MDKHTKTLRNFHGLSPALRFAGLRVLCALAAAAMLLQASPVLAAGQPANGALALATAQNLTTPAAGARPLTQQGAVYSPAPETLSASTLTQTPGGGQQTAAPQIWKNPYFAIDGENLYGAMTYPANAKGSITVNRAGLGVYIPLVYLSSDSVITDEYLRVTLELDPEAAVNVNTLRYELTAKKAMARTDRMTAAWLMDWRPDFKDTVTEQTVNARVHISAGISSIGGGSVLETEGILEIVFKAGKAPEKPGEDPDGPEDTDGPDNPGESDETDASDESDETDDTDEPDTPGETDESGETGNPDESGDPSDGNEPETEDPNVQIGDGGLGGVTESPVTWGGGGSSGEESPTAPPKLRILSCVVDAEEIHPGDRVNIGVTLKNSSVQTAVTDVRIVYESATGEVLPVNSTNSIYVDSISAGGTYNISFPVEVGFNVTSDSQKLTLTMEYIGKDAESLASSENIFLKITPSFDLKVDQPAMAPSVESGSAQDITVNVYNTGGSLVKNVICSLTMDGVTAAGSAFGGDVAAGGNATIVLHTLIGKLSNTGNYGSDSSGGADGTGADGSSGGTDGASGDASGMGAGGTSSGVSSGGASGSDAAANAGYGKTTGTILVQYEDEAGNEYAQEVLVTTQIIPPEGEELPKETVEKSSQWWVSIVCGLVAIQVVIFILIGVHRRRNI